MTSNFNLLTILHVGAFLFLAAIFIVVWLFPQLLNSQRRTKMIVCGGINSIFVAAVVWFTGDFFIPMPKIQLVTIAVVLFWSLIALFIGGYYDIRLRIELEAKYFDEMLRFRVRNLKYALVVIVISLVLGLITGWIPDNFGRSISGLLLAVIFRAIYGGFVGVLLDLSTKSP